MTYSGFYQEDHTKIIFRRMPRERIRSLLPAGVRVAVDKRSTLGRTDGGDEYEFALFELDGKLIVVQKDGGQV